MMHNARLFLFALIFVLISCSEDNAGNSGSGDHVWKDQVDTMDRAREAEQKMLDAAEAQRKAIEEQTQ